MTVQIEEAIVKKIIYYNSKNNWGVFTLQLPSTKTDKIQINDEVKVSGNFEGIYEGCKLDIVAVEVEHPTYGKQLQLQQYHIIEDNSSKESIINFLTKSSINGIHKVLAERIYEQFGKDSIHVVLHETEKLKEIKGIGEKTYNVVKNSVSTYFKMEELLKYCASIGLKKFTLIMQLYKEFGDNAVKILKENPYQILVMSEALTFNQIDEIAMRAGIPTDDDNRLKYGLLFVLYRESVLRGSTGCLDTQLKQVYLKTLGLQNNQLYRYALTKLSEENKIYRDEDSVYLREFYEAEKDISSKLYELNREVSFPYNGSIVDEEIHNFSFMLNDDQIKAINSCLKHQFNVITSLAGCVSGDTEYFNGEKWVAIKDYKQGDKVLQYNNDTKSAELVYPNNYIVEDADLFHIYNKSKQVNQVISKSHAFAYVKPNGEISTKLFGDIAGDSKVYSIQNHFQTNEEISTDLTPDRLKLWLAISADGSLDKKQWRIRVLKEHKIERLRELISKVGLEVDERVYADGSHNFYVPKEYGTKEFPSSWYLLPQELKQVFQEELFLWDGSLKSGKRNIKHYRTTIKSNADIAQFILSQLGTRCSINIDNRLGRVRNGYETKSVNYTVSVTKTKCTTVYMNDICKPHMSQTHIERYKSNDNKQYCFNVPSHLLVLRYQNNIFITGNCGKSTISKAIIRVLSRHHQIVTLLAPTAKAAKRLAECTGFQAQTIHRFLKIKDASLNSYEEVDVPRNCTILIDEASMVDVRLFNKVLEVIKPDTRVILVGDTHQLPSVQAGNLLEDIINSDKFNVCYLRDITRQAEDSNIIKYSNKVNEGNLIPTDLKSDDLVCTTVPNTKRYQLLEAIKKSYTKSVEKYGLLNVQIICAYKQGILGVNNLNNELRLAPPPSCKENEEIFSFRVGDKVRHTINNYELDVFNGETGVVQEILSAEDIKNAEGKDLLIVDYGDKIINYDKFTANELTLSYASTVHASQGSEYDCVYVVLDNEISNILLVRKIVYTAITRAKKKCYILNIDGCVNTAITNDHYKERITKLKDFIKDESGV